MQVERSIKGFFSKVAVAGVELTAAALFPLAARANAENIQVNGNSYCSMSFSSHSLTPFYKGEVYGIPPGQLATISLSDQDPYWLIESSRPGQRTHEPIPHENGKSYILRIQAVDGTVRLPGGRLQITSSRILHTEVIQGVDCDNPLAPSRYEI